MIGVERNNQSRGGGAMGIFSRRFSKSEWESSSLVLQWVDKKVKEHARAGGMNSDAMFAAYMYLLSLCIRPVRTPRSSESNDPSPFGSPADFGNDSALFELGCFVYSRLDVWLSANRPRHGPYVSAVLRDKFTQLFAEALNISKNATGELVAERIVKYQDLDLDDPEAQYSVLFPLILRTKGNQRPQRFDSNDFEFRIGFKASMIDNPISLVLLAWDADMFPSILNLVAEWANRAPFLAD